MLKTLIKKQFFEMFQGFFVDKKTNKSRSRAGTVAYIVFYFLLMIVLFGGMFTSLSMRLSLMFEIGYGWLYFLIMGLISVVFGVFGSVFSTYAAVYLSKDNELLLSMPVKVSDILISRLSSVFIMGVIYSFSSLIPAVVVFWFKAPMTALSVVSSVLYLINIPLLVFFLSCVLGYGVARISGKLKNKSIITVLISLGLIAVYYLVYFKFIDFLTDIITQAAVVGDAISSKAYILTAIGKAGEGDIIYTPVITAICILLCVGSLYVISKSFIKIVTTNFGEKKKIYISKNTKQKTVFEALLGKEFKRFSASANYMMNCALGVILIPAASIAVSVYADRMKQAVGAIFGFDAIAPLVVGLLMLLSSMNDISTPSVSLEGKNIWILKSLPIDPYEVLKAKLGVHLIITLIPVIFSEILLIAVLKLNVVESLFVVFIPTLNVFFQANFGMMLDLLKPNLSWTNEIYPIKQSISVLTSLFGGMVYSLIVMGVYLFLSETVNSILYLGILLALTVIFTLLTSLWLKKKGSVIFSKL